MKSGELREKAKGLGRDLFAQGRRSLERFDGLAFGRIYHSALPSSDCNSQVLNLGITNTTGFPSSSFSQSPFKPQNVLHVVLEQVLSGAPAISICLVAYQFCLGFTIPSCTT